MEVMLRPPLPCPLPPPLVRAWRGESRDAEDEEGEGEVDEEAAALGEWSKALVKGELWVWCAGVCACTCRGARE